MAAFQTGNRESCRGLYIFFTHLSMIRDRVTKDFSSFWPFGSGMIEPGSGSELGRPRTKHCHLYHVSSGQSG